MGWCFAPPLRAIDEHRETALLKRFDARFWTVDFPRPMLAAVVADTTDAATVTLAFNAADNLCGLIWESRDRWDHPLCAYATDRDYRGCTLRFRWRSNGLKPLDAVHGPVLTIEGRDANGVARSWYVRLWNYAQGTPQDAVITLDFDALDGGFLLPAEAQRVWAGDIDRLFFSLVPDDYDPAGQAYTAMREATLSLSDLSCVGPRAMLTLGDAMLGEHGLSIATAYDDSYQLTPWRLLRQVEALGYAGPLLHYVGMSHFPALVRLGNDWRADPAGVLAPPALAWHAAFAEAAAAMDLTPIWSLSYELFAAYCPPAWMQRDASGAPALTGWVPPSALLSPANAAAMSWLQAVALHFVSIAQDAALSVHFQVGEPWWWITPDRRICLYDAAATAALGAASVPIPDLGAALSAAQRAMLDAAGALLAQSTAALTAAVKQEASGATTYLLAYLPTVLDTAMPEARRANLPTGWADPAFDVLQLEDYDWAARGQAGLSAVGAAAATARLGYPPARQHYLAGFVLDAADKAQWAAIDAAADAARARGVARVFFWALPQIARDGFVRFGAPHILKGEDAVEPFADVDFPIAIGRRASVSAEFSTQVVTAASGHEQRVVGWSDARLRYDVGGGLRSEADIRSLLAFFRARRGAAQAFRFRDPLDASSAADNGAPSFADQPLGTGDGVRTDFALLKHYGAGDSAIERRITRPVPASVTVAVNGVAVTIGWTLAPLGVVRFAVPPAQGATVSAGFLFDVPVRFEDDQLELARGPHGAGEPESVTLIEVREA